MSEVEYEFEEIDPDEEDFNSEQEVENKLLERLKDFVKNEQTITEDELKTIFNEYVDATQVNIDDLTKSFQDKLAAQPEKFDTILESLMVQIQAKLDKRVEDVNFSVAQILSKLEEVENRQNNLQSNSTKGEAKNTVKGKSQTQKTGGFSFFLLLFLSLAVSAGAFVLERTYTHKLELDRLIQERMKEAQAIETAIVILKERRDQLKATEQ